MFVSSKDNVETPEIYSNSDNIEIMMRIMNHFFVDTSKIYEKYEVVTFLSIMLIRYISNVIK